MNNFLQVSRAEFVAATKPFSKKRAKLNRALLAYDGSFLSIESGEIAAVMRSAGEWHGQATFSPSILRALATVPPAQDPITISYADGHLLIGSMTIACNWRRESQSIIDDIENPSLLDLIAMERTMSRGELAGTELGKRIRSARSKMERRLKRASAQLEELEITEDDLCALVELRLSKRLIPTAADENNNTGEVS